LAILALSVAPLVATKTIEASKPSMAMTSNISAKVKPFWFLLLEEFNVMFKEEITIYFREQKNEN